MKVCTWCNEERELSEFYKSKANKDGLHHHCKICSKARDKARYQTETRRISKRNSEFQRFYGISEEEVSRMYQEQSGLCKICGTSMEFFSTSENKRLTFCVDHNHETGKVRGLLCSDCNRGIGFLKDNSEILRKAAEYLESSNG